MHPARLRVTLFLAVFGAILLSLGARPARAIVIVPPSNATTIPYVSGTYCRIQWGCYAYYPTPLVEVRLTMNGQVAYDYVCPPNTFQVPGVLHFDSTHFQNGDLTLVVQAWDAAGNYATAQTIYPVKNYACAYGNSTLGSFFVPEMGIEEMEDVNDYEGFMFYSQFMSQTADKSQILAAIPTYQVFFICTHAHPGVFYPCPSDGKLQADQIVGNDVGLAVSNKAYTVPPYAFVDIDGCYSAGTIYGTDSSLADAFQVSSGTNRAYLGWITDFYVTEANRDWNKRLWANLAAGYGVMDAALAADAGGFRQSMDDDPNNHGHALWQIFGDGTAKIHGLYGYSKDTRWHD